MSSRRLFFVSCATCSSVFAATVVASAASSTPTASLTVMGSSDAGDCPIGENLAVEINRVAKREAVTTDASRAVSARLALVFSREAGVFRAILRVQGDLAGERVFEDAGASCTGLARAVSVSTALLLDHIESTKVSNQVQFKPAAPPEVSKPLSFGIELDANLTTGLTRPGSMGYSLDTLVGSGRFMGGLGALWVPGRSYSFSPGEVELGLTAITMRGCWIAWQPTSVRLALLTCARGLAGWVHADAAGFDGTRDVRRTWLGAAADLELVGRLFGPLHWVLRADGLFPLRNERFTVAIDGQRQVAFEPAAAAILGGIGLMVSNF